MSSDNNIKRVLCLGLSGAGKSTLCRELSKKLNAVWWDSDDVRTNINTDLGFSLADRLDQSKRMYYLSSRVIEAGHYSICSFICPTLDCQRVFNPSDTFIIYLNTIKPEDSLYPDTCRIFSVPKFFDIEFTSWEDPKKMAETCIYEMLRLNLQDRQNYII